MFKFELSEPITNVVLEALAALPLHKAFDAFVLMRSQIAQQQAERSAVAVAPPMSPPLPSPPAPNGVDKT